MHLVLSNFPARHHPHCPCGWNLIINPHFYTLVFITPISLLYLQSVIGVREKSKNFRIRRRIGEKNHFTYTFCCCKISCPGRKVTQTGDGKGIDLPDAGSCSPPPCSTQTPLWWDQLERQTWARYFLCLRLCFAFFRLLGLSSAQPWLEKRFVFHLHLKSRLACFFSLYLLHELWTRELY